MKRRREAFPQMPDRLQRFDPHDWVPLVDDREYDPDEWRQVRDWEPSGEPWLSLPHWRFMRAEELFYEAQEAYEKAHPEVDFGIPGVDYGVEAVSVL